jgi:hypothetical protein
MANTNTQCYFHLVFAVKNRNVLIKKEWKNEMEMYVTGIVQNHRHKILAIGSMPDHFSFFYFHFYYRRMRYYMEMNIFLNFSIIYRNGKKYYGTLHL